ncbi:biotin/lipoyl-binding protein, partial [Candidatus Poribacteria bacterium]|nr:biotin/lipoyl-binding protein [Candidatus Poribacteria bacterium]
MRQNKLKKNGLSAIVSMVLVAILITSCGEKRGGAVNKAGAKTEKRVGVVKRGSFQERISATGNLEALVEVEVKSQVEGEIVTLAVDEGDYVAADDILLKLDPKRIIEERRQAEANVDAAKASVTQAELNTELKRAQLSTRLSKAEADYKIAESNLDALKAESSSRLTAAETDIQTTKNALEQDNLSLEQTGLALSQAKLTLIDNETALKSAQVSQENALSERDRNKDLFEKKYVAKRTLEETENRLASAESQYNSAKQRVAAQKESIESQKKAVKAKQSIIETRKTTLKYQELNLEKLREMRAAQEKRSQLQLEIAKRQMEEVKITIDQEQVVADQS